jgi:hypothetical protein
MHDVKDSGRRRGFSGTSAGDCWRAGVLRIAGVGALLLCFTANGQIPLGSADGRAVRLHNTDLAVLEAGDVRNDLPCIVSPDKPFLGFDLRFHSGYDVSVPLKELAGSENLLTILFRVTPADQPQDVHYFIQRIRVPSVEADAKGDAVLQGGFDVGEGKYKVQWLMRDRAERVCSDSWDVEAELPSKDKSIELTMAPGSIRPVEASQFREEPPVERSAEEALAVKVIVNFAPQKANAATLRPVDTAALVSTLRTLSREPRIGKFSVVAFNLNEQRVIYRQDNAEKINFPALGDSLDTLNLGTVDLQRLSVKNGETQFLAELIDAELRSAQDTDAVVFAGPKAMLEAKIPQDQLKKLSEIDVPVFYLNYALNPFLNPWRDSIGSAVKTLKGVEYTITRPRDLWFAVSEIVSKIVKSRNGKTIAKVSSN